MHIADKVYICCILLKQIRKPKPSKQSSTPAVIKHDEHLRTRCNCRNTGYRRVFSTLLKCSHMYGVFHQSVIPVLGFFICFMI